MATRRVLAALVLAPVFWSAPPEAASKEIRFKVKYSGSSISTHADTNGDGIRAGMGNVTGRSNLGLYTSQGVGEAVLAGAGTCPNGNAGINLALIPGTGHAVAWFERTRDLVFSEIVSETVCYDPKTGMQFKSGIGKITGGTGRFAGATGQTQFEGTQWPLYVDTSGNGFAAQTGTSTGTIILAGD
jgi:hypothetical protein